MWNTIFLVCGVAAFLAALAVPVFIGGLPVSLLAAPLLAYWKYRNDNVESVT